MRRWRQSFSPPAFCERRHIAAWSASHIAAGSFKLIASTTPLRLSGNVIRKFDRTEVISCGARQEFEQRGCKNCLWITPRCFDILATHDETLALI
jgi:hypothetical protein